QRVRRVARLCVKRCNAVFSRLLKVWERVRHLWILCKGARQRDCVFERKLGTRTNREMCCMQRIPEQRHWTIEPLAVAYQREVLPPHEVIREQRCSLKI